MDGRYPVPSGHRRLGSITNQSSSYLSPQQQTWSSADTHPEKNQSLARSKSDMDMSRLLRMPSSSQLSYNPPSAKSESFPQFREEKSNGMKSLLAKSSRLLLNKRKILRSMDLDNDNFAWTQDTTGRKLRPRHMTSPHFGSSHRPFISDPYNFRHLTHTGPAQAKVLQDTREDQLVTQFSVIRASQAPKSELKGIKAEDIISPYSPSPSRSPSPPQSPNYAINTTRPLRSIKSTDSFRRLASNSFSSPHPPISPPPRGSSRQLQSISQGLGLMNIDTSIQSPPTTSNSADTSPKSQFGVPLTSVEEPSTPSNEIAQAVTTPDNSAQLFITHQRNISSAGLADVPEEAELRKTEARIRELRQLRHARSFQASELLDRSASRFGEPIRPARPARTFPSTSAQTSWEDDIDYCYQHAMDAVDLAWEEETSWNRDLTQRPKTSHSTNPYSGSFFISSGAVNVDSATSSAVSVPDLVTPSETVAQRDSFATSHSLLFPLSPSAPASKESVAQVFNGEQDQQNQDADNTKDSFSYAPTTATDDSPRHSGSALSKWSSRESLSTRTASVITGSSKHRASSSIGSIPDMLPYGMSKRGGNTEMDSAPSQGSISSEIISQKLISAIPPPPTPTATRSRAQSESAGRLLDLSLIGAPAPITGNRTRAGSIASTRGRQSVATARPNYNLFPATSMVIPSK